jgi:hypothetical protein
MNPGFHCSKTLSGAIYGKRYENLTTPKTRVQGYGSRRRSVTRSARVMQEKNQNERRAADRFPIAREVATRS